jgi:2-dehydro-3-deoxyphosphooctonate aldolase (KDO 8-P synthase)
VRVIAGPCQHESLEHSTMIASHCKQVCDKYGVDYVFKASFDKANRTSLGSKRGLGLQKTCNDFLDMKESVRGLRILTDIHDAWQAQEVKHVVDVIQIPAFLCRQTDLIRAAVATQRIVNIKKGQFLSPKEVAGILSKTEGAREVWITERGTSFGYNNLVVDFTGLQYMLDHYGIPIILDATHSVQKPGGEGSHSGGDRHYVPSLVRAASALGVSNFFLEVHDDPDNAPSDGPNMLRLDDFDSVVEQAVEFHYAGNQK